MWETHTEGHFMKELTSTLRIVKVKKDEGSHRLEESK